MRSWVRAGLLAVLVLAACGGDDDEQAARPRASRPATQRDSVVRPPIYAEAEAVQILRAINENEIATSRVARERSQNDDILRYAAVMIADHRGMTELLDSLVQPIPDSVNAQSRALREAGSALVDSLWALSGGFNNTYVTGQIAAHEQALLLLDTAIIPSARDARVKKLLRDLRPAVVAHLQRARQIWAERQASGAAAATAPRPAPAEAPAPTRETPPAAAPAPTTPVRPAPPPPTDTLRPLSTTNMR